LPFSAGDIEATLTLKRDQFNRDLDAAKADAAKFSDKPITVKLKAEGVPEAKADLDKVAAAKVKAEGPAVVKVKAEGTAETVAALDKVAQARDKAGRFVTVKVGADTAEADIGLDKVEAKKARAGRPVTIPVKADTAQANTDLDKTIAKVQGLADKLKNAGGPFWLGPALLSVGALGTSAGVATAAVAGLGGGFTAGAGALAAFGAVAKPVLAGAEAAQKAAAAAQATYNTAIGKAAAQYQIASGAAKTHAQQLTALSALRKADATAAAGQALTVKAAYAGMSQAQVDLSRQLGTMSQGWKDLQAAQAPVVAGALVPWLTSVTSLTRQLPPIIQAVSPVIKGLGQQFGDLVSSQAFVRFRDFISSTGTATVSAAGSTIIDLVKSFITLLPQFDPLIREAVGHIADLGPAVLKWSQSKKASDDIQRFMQWFNQNGPKVWGLLQSIGGALKALAPGLTAGGTGELQVLTGFFSLIAKLPPSFAKPIAEVAGWLLILSKLGVVSVGVKVIGAAAGWISRLISGTTVTVAATAQQAAATAMQAAADTMVTAAAAMQRAADTMIGADAGAGKAGGAAGAGGKAAGAGGAAGAVSSGIGILGKAGIAAGGAAIAAGLILKVREDMKAGWKAVAADIPTALSGVGGVLTLASQGWSDLLVKPVETHVRAFWQRVEHDFAAHFAEIRHDFARWTDDLLHVTASGFDRIRHAASADLAALRHQAAVIFDGMRHETAHTWAIIYNNTIGAVIRMGKDAIAHLRSGLISPFEGGLKGAWNWLVSNFGVPLSRFFTSTLPGYWNRAIGFLRTNFVNPLESMFRGTWNWLLANFGTPIARWLTQTIPGYFATAVTRVRSAWSGITNAFIGPARTVVNNVINPLIADADTVLSFVHLPQIPKVPKFARGTSGAPPGWAWVGEQGPELVYMQGGEHVLPSPVSQRLAGAGMFPGYATGTAAAGAGGNPGGLGGVFGHVTGAISSALNWAKNLTLGALAATFTPVAEGLLNLMPKPASGAEGMIEAVPRSLVTDLIAYIKGKDPGAGVGGGSGADVAAYAKTFATGLGHPYVLGGASPSGWDCCLTGDTLIHGPDSMTPIRDIRAGGLVYSWEVGRRTTRAVLRQWKSKRQPVFTVRTLNATVTASANHPFLRVTDAGTPEWARLDQLSPGDLLVRPRELTPGDIPPGADFTTAPLLAVTPAGEADTWDVEIEGSHCFIADGLVVHNSGFSAFVYEHFGYFPEHQGSRHGTSESQFADPLLQSSGVATGALAFFNDGIFANPGHVGVVLNPSAHVSASGTAVGTIIGSNASAVGYRVPKGGFHAAGTSLGPGSSNFAADITTVLRSMGLPLSLVPNWLTQIQTESGGNPGAVNRTDSNAAAGHPSVGILQLIPSTFAAYAGPYRNTPPLVNFGGGFVSENIMAQIYAGIHYANARYGSSMASVIGHGHGYDEGGWLKPGMTMVMNRTGRPEPVLTGGQWDKLTSAVAGNDVCAKLDRIAGILASLPHATAAGVGDVINGTARAASLRARYPRS
jgi:SLT domain-containing protein